ncbi:MAG: hypothetical protein LW806_09055 [Planctomycetaceae bacterium]|nr:hypothetical protein [Planctomycetaceae bacterium]
MTDPPSIPTPPPLPTRVETRILPCDRCAYDLRGRHVGESCPECGWTIDSALPTWWDERLLRRIALWARVATVPCWMLLLVPLHFVLSIAELDSIGRFEWTFGIFLVLMPLQVLAQLVSVLALADDRLGRTRSRILVAAALVRLLAFGLAVAVIAYENTVVTSDGLLIFGYFALPVLAIGADIATVRVFANLRKEVQPILGMSQGSIAMIARGFMWGVYPLLIVPFVGWFFAPIIWTVAMALCFGELRRVAKASREALASLQA